MPEIAWISQLTGAIQDWWVQPPWLAKVLASVVGAGGLLGAAWNVVRYVLDQRKPVQIVIRKPQAADDKLYVEVTNRSSEHSIQLTELTVLHLRWFGRSRKVAAEPFAHPAFPITISSWKQKVVEVPLEDVDGHHPDDFNKRKVSEPKAFSSRVKVRVTLATGQHRTSRRPQLVKMISQ